ncbi:MAG: hypothetical protein Tsb002_26640 [Wenzhouxiangellaceae bacterium]
MIRTQGRGKPSFERLRCWIGIEKAIYKTSPNAKYGLAAIDPNTIPMASGPMTAKLTSFPGFERFRKASWYSDSSLRKLMKKDMMLAATNIPAAIARLVDKFKKAP